MKIIVAADGTLSKSEFAAYLNVKRGYVTQLITAGRVVLTDDGQRVRVDESVELINATRDPSRQGTVDRHAANRAAAQQPALQPAPQPPPPTGDITQELKTDKAGSLYQASKALREKYNAMAAKRDYEISTGELLRAADVARIVATAATIVRARLEAMPDILSPQLAAETDEQRCRTALLDHVELTLAELSRQFQKLAHTPPETT
jgi:excisionase family DNA binding protein